VVGAKDERHGVEEEYGRLGLVWHGSEFISSGVPVRYSAKIQVSEERLGVPSFNYSQT
jgi:hypothetical protein